MRINAELHCRHNGNWIINLTVLLCNFNIIISCDWKNGTKLPSSWPCSWNNGVVPFVYNYYSLSPKRLISLVQRGHAYIEERSCLKFEERDPILVKNDTFLFYSYSGVLESCCLPFYTKSNGRRVHHFHIVKYLLKNLILITPICTLPSEVAHVTLHGLGLKHERHEPFSSDKTKAVLFPHKCKNAKKKLAAFKIK